MGVPPATEGGGLIWLRGIGVDTVIVVWDDSAYVTHSLRSGRASPEGWAPSGAHARQGPVGCSSRARSKIAGVNQDVVIVTVTKLSSLSAPFGLAVAAVIHD